MTDPWAGLASLLATVIEKYGAEILREIETEQNNDEFSQERSELK